MKQSKNENIINVSVSGKHLVIGVLVKMNICEIIVLVMVSVIEQVKLVNI